MKIPDFKRLIPQELGGRNREIIEKMATRLNDHLDLLTDALQRRLSLENENADRVEFQVKHGVATSFGYNVRGDSIDEVAVTWSEQPVDAVHWEAAGQEKITITVWFREAPTSPVKIRVKVKGY